MKMRSRWQLFLFNWHLWLQEMKERRNPAFKREKVDAKEDEKDRKFVSSRPGHNTCCDAVLLIVS